MPVQYTIGLHRLRDESRDPVDHHDEPALETDPAATDYGFLFRAIGWVLTALRAPRVSSIRAVLASTHQITGGRSYRDTRVTGSADWLTRSRSD